MNDVVKNNERVSYVKEQKALPLKDREWKIYGSLDNFKKSYCETLTPYIEKDIITKEEANEIYRLSIIEEKFAMPSEITDIKVLLKDGYEPTESGSTLKFRVNDWYIYSHFAGGLNALTIKKYK